MAILQFKNADGNWESFVDYDMLAEIKAGVDELLAGQANSYIIEPGTYTLAASPDVSYVPTGPAVSDYLFADILLHNTRKLEYGYGLNIFNGNLQLLSVPQSLSGTLNGSNIYTNGAYVDSNSNVYKVPIKTVVPEAFYTWWNANTTKS